jgi:hypothetical protein
MLTKIDPQFKKNYENIKKEVDGFYYLFSKDAEIFQPFSIEQVRALDPYMSKME